MVLNHSLGSDASSDKASWSTIEGDAGATSAWKADKGRDRVYSPTGHKQQNLRMSTDDNQIQPTVQ